MHPFLFQILVNQLILLSKTNSVSDIWPQCNGLQVQDFHLTSDSSPVVSHNLSLVAHAVWWEKGKRRESSSLLPSLCKIYKLTTIPILCNFPNSRQRDKKNRIQCPNFVESRFSDSSRIPFPVKIFYVFQNPAPYFGQIPDPVNILSNPVLWPSKNYKIYNLNDLSLKTFYEVCKFFSLCKVRNCNTFSKRRFWSLRSPASILWKPALGNFF